MGIGKIELDGAQSIALRVLDHIKPALDRGEIAGSIRRQKPIVGDVEIVAVSSKRDQLLKLLEDVGVHIKPGVPGFIPWTPKPTAKYLRVRLSESMNLDLFLATPNNWGGLFMMRTGGAADLNGNPYNGFVPGIFGRWKKMSNGGRMTECMPTMPSGEQLWVPEEQDFFDILEMNFVPPTERISKNVIKNYSKE